MMATGTRHLLSELRRRKVYHVALVYAAVGYGVAAGAEYLFGLLDLPPVWAQAAAAIVLLGFPIALVLAWAFEIRPERPAPEAGYAEVPKAPPSSERSIAVLPFESLSSDPEGDYFADGITEELTNALARQKGLRVAARTSAFAFKGERTDIREIGRRLNVSHVIEGSVRRSDQALRITAQLIDTQDGYHLWSDQFDREHGDVFRIQEEIAECVVRGLLDDVQEGDTPSIATAEFSAYDSFLKGRYHLAKFEPDSILEAIRHFEQAIQLDDRFAPALAGLAEALTLQSIGFSEGPNREIMARAEEVSLKAVTLDPRLPEAQLARGLCLMYWDWDFAGAKEGFDRAIELNPNFLEAHLWTEFYWTYVEHDFEEAVAANRRAQRLSPLDTRVRGRLATVHYLFGKLEEAERLLLEEISENPDYPLPHLSMADTLVRMGRVDEGVSQIETAVRLGGRPMAFLGMLCGFYGLQGNRDQATAVLEELEARHAKGSVPGFWMAVAYVGLGRLDEAFASLDRGVEERDSNLLYLTHAPRAFGMQEDPRFPPLLEKIGLGHLLRFL
jgi:adenylate cyclase